jgi:hypothetical protein
MAWPKRSPLDRHPSRSATIVLFLGGLFLTTISIFSHKTLHWFGVGFFGLTTLIFMERLYRFYRH